MSNQICPICDIKFVDKDDLVAIVLSKFVDIPSSVVYAIEDPTKCLEIVHSECYDWEDHDDLIGGAN